MKCTVDENCPEEATQRFTWAWGQEGATCDAHRAVVESQSTQLQRGVSWAPVGEPKTDPGRNRPPLASRSTAELLAAQGTIGELTEKLKTANAEISSLRVRVMQLEAELGEVKRVPPNEPESVMEGEAPPKTPHAKEHEHGKKTHR